jgi:hypothetical protein
MMMKGNRAKKTQGMPSLCIIREDHRGGAIACLIRSGVELGVFPTPGAGGASMHQVPADKLPGQASISFWTRKVEGAIVDLAPTGTRRTMQRVKEASGVFCRDKGGRRRPAGRLRQLSPSWRAKRMGGSCGPNSQPGRAWRSGPSRTTVLDLSVRGNPTKRPNTSLDKDP